VQRPPFSKPATLSNPHYIASRYPVDVSYTKDMAEEAVAYAEEGALMGKRITKEMTEGIRKFKKTIEADKVILFGSYATGTAGKDSDIDLILVSKKFTGKKFHQRLKGMWLKWTLDMPVDFVPYTPGEFKKAAGEAGIVSEALREGIEI